MALRILAVLAMLLAAGCAAPGGRTPRGQPSFPANVGPFEQIEPPITGRASVTAGYQLLLPDGPVIATVQWRPTGTVASLLPSLDLGGHDAEDLVDAAVPRSLAQIRRFYPDASAGEVHGFLVPHGGKLHPGRQFTATFQDSTDATPEPIAMEVNLVCCNAQGEIVEFRFRHAPGLAAAREQSAFVRDFPWTRAAPR